MAFIEKFTHQPAFLAFEPTPGRTAQEIENRYGTPIGIVGGYDPATGTLTAMCYSDSVALHVYLDSITGAIENGLVDDRRWPRQLFASNEDFTGFVAKLRTLDGFRFHDRWATALALITNERTYDLNDPAKFAQVLADDAEGAFLNAAPVQSSRP